MDLNNRVGQWSIAKMMDVSMPEICGDYESAQDVPEWVWVKEHASFSHVENNGDNCVYEFIVNVAMIDPRNSGQPLEAPAKLQPLLEEAIQNGVGYILFYND
jgi:hypothetical protein